MPSRLPSWASSCRRAAMCGRHQHLERNAQLVAVACASLTTSSSGSTRSRSRSSAATSYESPFFQAQPPSAFLRRSYHSFDHPSPAEPFSPTERAILAAAYAHVPEHGFSQESLALGARDAGYLDISTNLLPDDAFSLVQWHMVVQRESLAGRARELFSGDPRMSVSNKVEALVWDRLMGNKAVIERWQEVRSRLYRCRVIRQHR